MENKNDIFCPMPWIGGHVDVDGDVRPCCEFYSTKSWGNVKEKSLREIMNGSEAGAIRERMLKGESDEGCRSCLSIEAVGGSSQRQYALAVYPEIETETYKTKELSLRFNNSCNLACISCNPRYSTSVGKRLGQVEIHNSMGKDRIDQLIDEEFEDVEQVYISGGEPLTSEMHFYFLQQLIAEKKTSIALSYNSNLMSIEFKGYSLVDLWKKFKRVEIYASIDGHKKVNDKIRVGSSFDIVIRNLEAVKKCGVLANVNFTCSRISIEGMVPLYRELKERGFIEKGNEMKISPLCYPEVLQIKWMDEKKKRDLALEVLNLIEEITSERRMFSSFFASQLLGVLKELKPAKIESNQEFELYLSKFGVHLHE